MLRILKNLPSRLVSGLLLVRALLSRPVMVFAATTGLVGVPAACGCSSMVMVRTTSRPLSSTNGWPFLSSGLKVNRPLSVSLASQISRENPSASMVRPALSSIGLSPPGPRVSCSDEWLLLRSLNSSILTIWIRAGARLVSVPRISSRWFLPISRTCWNAARSVEEACA